MQAIIRKHKEAVSGYKEIARVLESEFVPALYANTAAEFEQFVFRPLPTEGVNADVVHECAAFVRGLAHHPYKYGTVRCEFADILMSLNKSPTERALLVFSHAPFAAIASRPSLESDQWTIRAADARDVPLTTYFVGNRGQETSVYFYLPSELKVKLNGIPERLDFAELMAATEMTQLPIRPLSRDGNKVYVAAKIPTVDRRTLSNLEEEIANLPFHWPEFNLKALAGMIMYKRAKREEILAISETKIFALTDNELNISASLTVSDVDKLIEENETALKAGETPSGRGVMDLAKLA